MTSSQGNTSEDNVKITLNILNNSDQGPKRDITILNAAAAIVAADKADNLQDGVKVASDSITSGKALEKLNKLVEWTNK